MGARIEQNLTAARLLADRCESFDQEVPDINATQLLARVKKRLLLACDRADAGCPFALKAQVKTAATWFKTQSVPETVGAASIDFLKKLEKFDEAVKRLGDNKLPDFQQEWEAVRAACRTAPNRYQCAQAQNKLVATLGRAVEGANEERTSIAATWADARASWQSVIFAIEQSRAERTDSGRQAVSQIEATLAATERSLRSILELGVDEFRADFFNRLLPTAAAEKMFDFTERQLEPVDRLLEKADDKFYLLGSLALEMNRADIQGYFDTFYIEHVREKFQSTDSAVAFARAACVRLSKPTPAGKPASLITPFLYSALTRVGEEVEVKQACLRKGSEDSRESVTPGKEQECELELAKVRRKAVVDLKEKLPSPALTGSVLQSELNALKTIPLPGGNTAPPMPVRPPAAVSPDAIYDVCLSSEVAVRKQSVSAGDILSTVSARQASQDVCAQYVLGKEQARYKAPDHPASFALNPTGQETVLALDVMAAQAVHPGAGEQVSGIHEAVKPVVKSNGKEFCKGLRMALKDAVCIDGADSSWIELPGVFASGRFESASMVSALRTLSRAIDTHDKRGRAAVVVFGSASDAPVKSKSLQTELDIALKMNEPLYRCPPTVVAGTPDASRNTDLARQRAKWAAGVMGRTTPELKRKLMACPLVVPERGDQPFDRKLALRVNW